MPIFEFSCRACHVQFERLIRPQDTAACPACGSSNLERLLSLPVVHSSTTRQLALKAAKKRDARQGSEQRRAQREYELNHD